MAFGSLESSTDGDGDVAEINMVPLIDVMLVLLVIFIVAAPLMTHSVKVDLPQASAKPQTVTAPSIELSIDADSRLHWNGQPLDAATLSTRLKASAQASPQPELHIRADRRTPYEAVAQAMAAAAREGLTRIGFVTLPVEGATP